MYVVGPVLFAEMVPPGLFYVALGATLLAFVVVMLVRLPDWERQHPDGAIPADVEGRARGSNDTERPSV